MVAEDKATVGHRVPSPLTSGRSVIAANERAHAAERERTMCCSTRARAGVCVFHARFTISAASGSSRHADCRQTKDADSARGGRGAGGGRKRRVIWRADTSSQTGARACIRLRHLLSAGNQNRGAAPPPLLSAPVSRSCVSSRPLLDGSGARMAIGHGTDVGVVTIDKSQQPPSTRRRQSLPVSVCLHLSLPIVECRRLDGTGGEPGTARHGTERFGTARNDRSTSRSGSGRSTRMHRRPSRPSAAHGPLSTTHESHEITSGRCRGMRPTLMTV